MIFFVDYYGECLVFVDDYVSIGFGVVEFVVDEVVFDEDLFF